MWEVFLNRKLTATELNILKNVRDENKFNDLIDTLAVNANKKNLYIPALSELHGNCLFESLELIKIIDDHNEFRQDVASVMRTFKTMKNFFCNQPETLEELFVFMNEIEFVFDKNECVLYKYTYDMMCVDLSHGFSWTRLPTQLILMTISLLLNARIHILSNTTEYQHTIYTGLSPPTIINDQPTISIEICKPPIDIYMGHIGEVHYVPLSVKQEGEVYEIPKYADARVAFFEWGKKF
jgi:hypothetical protein